MTVAKIAHLKPDLATTPSRITNIETHEDYRPKYRVEFQLWTENMREEITPRAIDQYGQKGAINHKVVLTCECLDSQWVLGSSEYTDSKQKIPSSVCFLTPRTSTSLVKVTLLNIE